MLVIMGGNVGKIFECIVKYGDGWFVFIGDLVELKFWLDDFK